MRLLLVLLIWTLSACAAAPVQKQLVPVHGVAIETLQGSVNISLTSTAGKMSGNGVLHYLRPDTFRLTLLAPFGQSLFDIVVKGENVICLAESRRKVWAGRMRDLPDQLGVRIWPLLSWVVEPPHRAGPSLERSFMRADGTMEKVFYDNSGFVQRKVSAAGDEVVYSDYRPVDGIAVPGGIAITTADGSGLSLTFDEPEINRPISADIFSPQLDGYEILPLVDFKEF